MKTHEFSTIERKLDLVVRQSKDRLAWFEHDGRRILFTGRSNKKGELPASHQIRQQLKLDEDQLRELIRCTLDRDGYIAILKIKGIIT